LFASILILNEINGTADRRSLELDRLTRHLGGDWAYVITTSGGSQRIAILYDSAAARRASCVELEVPPRTVQGKDILARDPLACRFVLRARDGSARNDLVIVGVHLAAGQHLVTNHNDAMAALRDRLRQAVQAGTFAAGERDVLIGGDFNASRYDNHVENFWENFDGSDYRLRALAPSNDAEYPGTRLAGHPLFPRSRIDYLLASEGLLDDLVLPLATVHVDLLPADFSEFRARFSDHLPVTVRVRVVVDDDP
jgi:endonuclease/exonuclease/phosphatase family metal-dependent hydrolase